MTSALSPEQIRHMISEERELHNLRVRVHEYALLKRERLLSEGYPEHIVEGAVMDFLGSFGTEFLKGYKNQFARWLISNIGVDPNSFIAQVIGNIVEETPIRTLWSWVTGGGGGCEEFGEKLAIGIIETIEERFMNPLMGQMGFRNVATGSIGGTFREQLQTMINSSEFMQQIIQVMTTTVCEFNMGSILGVGGGWNKKAGPEGSSAASGSDSSDAPSAGEEMMRGIDQSADMIKTVTGGGRQDGIAARGVRGVADAIRSVVN